MLSLGENTFGDPPLRGDERGDVFGTVNNEGDLAVGTDDRRAHRTPPTIFELAGVIIGLSYWKAVHGYHIDTALAHHAGE